MRRGQHLRVVPTACKRHFSKPCVYHTLYHVAILLLVQFAARVLPRPTFNACETDLRSDPRLPLRLFGLPDLLPAAEA